MNGAPVTGIADHGELVGGGAVQDGMDRRSTYEKQAASAEQHGERPEQRGRPHVPERICLTRSVSSATVHGLPRTSVTIPEEA